MNQEELFNNLDVLEKWYELNIVNLEEYMKLKSNVIDIFRHKLNEELPF